MRKFILALAVACVSIFSTSCEKDENGNPVYKMNATIDSKEWVAPIPAAVLTNGTLTITGTSVTGETILLTVNGEAAGTYELVTPLKMQCGATYKASLAATTADAFVSATGKVVITKFDTANKQVSGTFEFNLANTALAVKQIKNGSFNNVTYLVK